MWPFRDKRTQEEKELAAKFVESVLAGEWEIFDYEQSFTLSRCGVSFYVYLDWPKYHNLPEILTLIDVCKIRAYKGQQWKQLT